MGSKTAAVTESNHSPLPRCSRVTLAAGPWLFEAWCGINMINKHIIIVAAEDCLLPQSEITCFLKLYFGGSKSRLKESLIDQ